MASRGILRKLLPTLHEVMLNFCERLGGNSGWYLPTFRKRKIQFAILLDNFDFVLQRNNNRALQYDDCQLGNLLSPTKRAWPCDRFADLFYKKRIS